MPVVIHGINVRPLIMNIIASPPARLALQRLEMEPHALKLKLWLPLYPILL